MEKYHYRKYKGENGMNLKDAGIYDLVNIFKGEATTAHAASQGGIINNTSRFINIPAYQRPYRWKTDNIVRLFQDYEENNEEYFLGSAVVVEKKKADGTVEFDVVDGQQRLTTLYLLNYIRFLLRREYTLAKLSKPYQPKASEYCTELKKCYVNLIGKNAAPFNAILAKIEELMSNENEELDPNERVEQLVSCYKEQLCIAETKTTPQETLEERLKQAHNFFDNEQLCLKYSRSRYDTVLKNALCTVYLKNVQDTTEYILDTIINPGDDQFIINYLDALRTILKEIWKRAKNNVDNDNAGIMEICEKAIELADNIIKNMSLCIVLTENENDANKLFEVLNDRSLEVEDLELIKNHFYKEYCTKSSDSDVMKDIRITELDELWADKIFNGNGDFRNRLISYLGAVFFTCDKELGYKDDAKLKDAIEKNYSSKNYDNSNPYTYEHILADFNTYYAVKIILDLFEVKAQRLNEVALKAEQEDKSITYKTIHLLNALKYHAVIPALTNVIISAYAKNHSLTDTEFESSFKNFIKGLIEDKDHTKIEYKKIHQCAYMLWISSIKGKDYVIPRTIAKRIISKYGHVGFSDENMDFHGIELHEMDNELEKWLNDWNYYSNKTFAIKILLLNLLVSQRIDVVDAYKASSVTIKIRSALTYKLDAGKLHLDHLEANIINSAAPQSYYLQHDAEKRQKDVNGYIGNFMILDAVDNNQKNNVPMCKAMQYYAGIKTSWLIEDISSMMKDPLFFDLQLNVPREEFFIERSKRLKKYFKAFLGKQLDDKQVTIDF